MRVLLISQCSKNALPETRRILDQFAERKGDCIWETQITQQGLNTLKKLLRATARRNTAVACHLQRGRQGTELLWIVGNRKKFNDRGIVPTNITSKDILRIGDEKGWNTAEAISILTNLAALFHDFGKANDLFQAKLKGKSKKSYEPFRHEWMSLILFKQFVGSATNDKEWLERLSNISCEESIKIENWKDIKINPLKQLPPVAKFIGWLILSHHLLPISKEEQTDLAEIDHWMNGKSFNAKWNSFSVDEEWTEDEKEKVCNFSKGTPFASSCWRKEAQKAAKRALQYYPLIEKEWLQDRFSMHLARTLLMLSDHIYSAQDAHKALQDSSCQLYANTDCNKKLKQKLDEHNLGVAKTASFIARRLPGLIENLPVVASTQSFKKRSRDAKFFWQNEAYDLASSLKKESASSGFFGVNLASTGCGKTLANAKIMYALSDERKGCRFNIALGLRVLTLQTGEALRSRLSLSEDELAIMIGSSGFQELYEMKEKETGSESIEEIIDEEWNVECGLELDDERIKKWLKKEPKLKRLIASPILVSTIDHLILATESGRGGKQIAPILRLLNSDLVLDEPDDFDVNDLPALTRLVNFAGVFGAKVLISSATLPPSLVKALFEAYSSGRAVFNRMRFPNEKRSGVVCAWFDEYQSIASLHTDTDSFMHTHEQFIANRIVQLEKQPGVRKGVLVPVSGFQGEGAYAKAAQAFLHSVYTLHEAHCQMHSKSGKKISIGLVRMAHINSLVKVVKEFLSKETKNDYTIHFCVYHSRFSMVVRSKIEEILDRVLKRHDPDRIWQHPEIIHVLESSEATNHIFIVFGTSVTEVGRDHDYDWAVIEPSSMRSIIQLAGRIQRHRQEVKKVPNVHILHKNINALEGKPTCYAEPGFENDSFRLEDKNLEQALHPEQYSIINAIPRLRCQPVTNPNTNLVDLEHARLEDSLFKGKRGFCAALWWRYSPDWCYEIQKRSRFRQSQEESETYIELLSDADEEPVMHLWPRKSPPESFRKFFHKESFQPAKGNQPWFVVDVKKELLLLAEKTGSTLEAVSKRFAQVSLKKLSGDRAIDGWMQNPLLGFYCNKEEK